MKPIAGFLLMMGLVAAWSSDPPNSTVRHSNGPVIAPPGSAYVDYWPLKAGNSWTYDYRYDHREVLGTSHFVGRMKMEVVSDSAVASGIFHSMKLTFSGWSINRNASPVRVDSVYVSNSVVTYRYFETSTFALLPLIDYTDDPFKISILHSGLIFFDVHRKYDSTAADPKVFQWTNGVSKRSARFERLKGLTLWESSRGQNTFWRLRMSLQSWSISDNTEIQPPSSSKRRVRLAHSPNVPSQLLKR